MKPSTDAWNDLAARLRTKGAPTPVAPQEAPYGFSTRVVSLWKSAQAADRQLALWQRLAWRSAALTCLAAVGVWVSQTRSAEPLMQVPTVSLPVSL
jgi:hypothetical protein